MRDYGLDDKRISGQFPVYTIVMINQIDPDWTFPRIFRSVVESIIVVG